MVRAIGSYPIGHKFESHRRYQTIHEETRSIYYGNVENGPLVKRLRHHPFTVVSWVRVPYESPRKWSKNQRFAPFLLIFEAFSGTFPQRFPNHFFNFSACLIPLKSHRSSADTRTAGLVGTVLIYPHKSFIFRLFSHGYYKRDKDGVVFVPLKTARFHLALVFHSPQL